MIVELAVDDFLRRPDDGAHPAGVDELERMIDLGRGALDDGERADQRPRHALGADAEVLDRALGLGAPVTVGRDFDRAEAVGLDPGASFIAFRGSSRDHHFLRKRSSRTTSAPALSPFFLSWSGTLSGAPAAASGLAGTLLRLLGRRGASR